MEDLAPDGSDRVPDFRLAVRTLLARRSARLHRHPDPAVLVEFHRRRLAARAAARLREHLALCPACGDLVLGLSILGGRRPG